MENSWRVVDGPSLVAHEGEMGPLRPVLATRCTPHRRLFRFSKQFRKRNSANFVSWAFSEVRIAPVQHYGRPWPRWTGAVRVILRSSLKASKMRHVAHAHPSLREYPVVLTWPRDRRVVGVGPLPALLLDQGQPPASSYAQALRCRDKGKPAVKRGRKAYGPPT